MHPPSSCFGLSELSNQVRSPTAQWKASNAVWEFPKVVCCHGGSFAAMAANEIYFYFASNKPNHGPIGEERRGSSKMSADDIRMKKWVLPFSVGSRARWSGLTLILNFFSLFCLCGTNFLIKAVHHIKPGTVLLPGEEHGCCWVEIFYCCMLQFGLMAKANLTKSLKKSQ